MIIKIVTDCAYAGCSTTHYVKVADGMTEREIENLANIFLEEDIQPSVFWEESSEEDAEEECQEIEEL